MILLALLIVPLLTGIICFAIRSVRWLERLNLVAFAGCAALAVMLAGNVVQNGPVEAVDHFFYADALSSVIILVTAFVSLVCGCYAVGFFRCDHSNGKCSLSQVRRYYRLTPLFVFSMLLVTLANNLGVMWVAVEGTTLSCVLLIAFYNEKTSLEAAWKYIMIGSVGIALALFGTILTYYSAAEVLGPETSFGMNWSLLVTKAGAFDSHAMKLGFIMALLGYGTKAGLAPMHTWKPDAYSQAPIPAATLLASGVLNCAVYAILRFYILATKCMRSEFPGTLLLFFGLLSLIVAVPFILVQRNYRRLLAYSSIEHAGIIVTAVGFGGKLGMLGAVLHMVFHGVTKPLIFFCAGNIQQHYGTPFSRKVRGVFGLLPLTGVLFLMATFAVTAVPPFSLFQSEFMILSGGFESNHAILSALFIFCAVAIFAGFLQHVVHLNFGNPMEQLPTPKVDPWKTGIMIFLGLFILWLGFQLPAPLYKLIQNAADIIGGNL